MKNAEPLNSHVAFTANIWTMVSEDSTGSAAFSKQSNFLMHFFSQLDFIFKVCLNNNKKFL